MDRSSERKRALPKRYRDEEEVEVKQESPSPTRKSRKVIKRRATGNSSSHRPSSATSVSAPAHAPRAILPAIKSEPGPAINLNMRRAQSSTAIPVPVPVPVPVSTPRPAFAPTPIRIPFQLPRPITWRSIERLLPPSALRLVTIGERIYPLNDISLLRPSALLLLLKVLSTLIPLLDVYKLLHLEDDEIEEVEQLVSRDNRRVVHQFERGDGRDAERIIRAYVREGEVLEGLVRCLGALVERFGDGGSVMLEEVEKMRMPGLNVEAWR